MITEINHSVNELHCPVKFFSEMFTQAAVICQLNKRGNDTHRECLDKTPIITLLDDV